MLFEDGIEPDWDDPGNEHGGLWLAHSSDMALNTVAEDGNMVTLHTIWLDTVRCHPHRPPRGEHISHAAGMVRDGTAGQHVGSALSQKQR